MVQIPVLLRVQVPLTQAYEDDQMKLCDTHVQLLFRLVGNGGEAVAETEAGIWKRTGERIVARLRVPYRFHALTDVLELCGNAMADENTSSLSLCGVGGMEHTRLRPHQTQCGSLRGEQYLPLREALRGVWGHIKSACMENGVSLRTRNPLPKALEPLCAVYQRGVLTAVYDPRHDAYDPEKIDGVRLGPFKSTISGTTTARPAGTNLLNVIGSSGRIIGGVRTGPDRPTGWAPASPIPTPPGYIYFTWKGIWEAVAGGGVAGSSNFCGCATVGHVCTVPSVRMPHPYLGGHMIAGVLGVANQHVPQHGVAEIIPICVSTNNHPNRQFQARAAGVNAVDITNFLA